MAKRQTSVGRGASGTAGPRVQRRRVRADGWTAERQVKFFALLADTANVTLSAGEVGMTRSAAYARRGTHAAFAAAWEAALKSGIDRIEMLLIERSMNGVEKPILWQGREVRTVRIFSEATIMRLLQAHKPETYGGVGGGARQMAAARRPPVIDAAVMRRQMIDLIEGVIEERSGAG